MKSSTTIDEYIDVSPAHVHEQLRTMRQLIHEVAPDTTETISYGIPTFVLQGKNLVHFAGYSGHIGFYPGAAEIELFRPQLTSYKLSKGTIQFPLDKPLPHDLIQEIVSFRLHTLHQ